jgi:hypothetical protein
VRASLLLVLMACDDFGADLNQCLAVGKCECPYGHSFAPVAACGNDRDLYVSWTGSDSNPGTSASAPRASLDGVSLLPGDRVHFTGTFQGGFETYDNGTAGCPITFDGDATFVVDGGNGVRLGGSNVRFSGFHFEEFNSGDPYISGGLVIVPAGSEPASDVLVENLTVDTDDDMRSAVYLQGCVRCTIRGSAFTGTGGKNNVVSVWASDETQLLNNKVSTGSYGPAFDLREDTHSLIAGNELIGVQAAAYEQGDQATGNIFRRNLVHDVSGGVIVDGASLVLHNTFVNLGDATVSTMGVFRGNIVSLAGIGLDAGAPGSGGYNLFDAASAYASGPPGSTDLTGPPKLDPTTYAPLPGSPVIDAADPNDPVPFGGGARADIGAIEAGAVTLPGGGVCEDFDAGF